MYYIGDFWGQTFIYNQVDESVMIGPFNDGFDAHFVCELLNSGKLSFNKGESYGKEDLEKSHSVY